MFCLLLFLFTASFQVFSQIQIKLAFTGKDSQTQNPLPLDNIYIHNLTEECDTILANVTTSDSVALIIPDATAPVGIHQTNAGISGDFLLKQNYPNPFSGSTNLCIYRENRGPLKLVLYDGSGRKLASYQNEFEKGLHSFVISSAGTGVLVLSVSDNKNKKSVTIINTKQDQAYNGIKYVGQLPNVERRILKNSDDSGFYFYLGNQMSYTAHTNGYADLTIVDSPTSDSTYVFNMTLLSLPEVTTSAVSNITQTTAACGGTVLSDGGDSVTVRGVCWSTSPNPTTSDFFTTDGSGTGVFTSNVTGLIAGTPYYLRAYATNSIGTEYGNELSFPTLAPPVDSVAAINDTLLLCYSKCFKYVEQLFLFDAVYSNNILAPDGSWSEIYDHAQTQSSNNAKILRLWSDAYDIIYKANFVILSSEEAISDPLTKNTIIAQAKAIRAYLNYNMMNWFGEIPLEAGASEGMIPRNTVEEVLIHINQDLTEASQSLPMTWPNSDSFRIPRSFAVEILARTSLYSKKYNEALNLAQQIINSGIYALSTDTNHFTVYNVEIFWGFEKTNNTEFNNFFTKGSYVPVARYTESLLISAESSFNSGNTASALNYINILNARRGNPTISSLTNDELYHQWHTELVKEGSMFTTLKRFDKALSVVQNFPHKLLLPVPLPYLINNVNLTQNPGY